MFIKSNYKKLAVPLLCLFVALALVVVAFRSPQQRTKIKVIPAPTTTSAQVTSKIVLAELDNQNNQLAKDLFAVRQQRDNLALRAGLLSVALSQHSSTTRTQSKTHSSTSSRSSATQPSGPITGERYAVPANVPAGWETCPYKSLIYSYFGQYGAGAWATGIAWRESRCRPGALGAQGDKGLFQLYGHDDMFTTQGCYWGDPDCNTRVALSLFNKGNGICNWQAPYYCSRR